LSRLLEELPPDWRTALERVCADPISPELEAFVEAEYAAGEVFPPRQRMFAALKATPLSKVRVAIVGQDPYHGAGQAHGLCFSVAPGVAAPPSLKNILRELKDDLGIVPPDHGCLLSWARQGVLLTNAVLTVRSGEPQSHAKRGWERFTDAALRAVAAKQERVVFLLWGKPAQAKRSLVEREPHVVLTAAHPSPLAARYGFFGSKPFSRANAALVEAGLSPVDWNLPPVDAGELP
jgi:uracil-DNA glycosylase